MTAADQSTAAVSHDGLVNTKVKRRAVDQQGLFDQRSTECLNSLRKSGRTRILPPGARLDTAYPTEYPMLDIAKVVKAKYYESTSVLEFLRLFGTSLAHHVLLGDFDRQKKVFLKKRLPRRSRVKKLGRREENALTRMLDTFFDFRSALPEHNVIRDKLRDLGSVLLRPSMIEYPAVPHVRLDTAWFNPNNPNKVTHAFEVHSQNWDWKPAVASLYLTGLHFPACRLFMVVIYDDQLKEIKEGMGSDRLGSAPKIQVMSIDDLRRLAKEWKGRPKQFQEVFKV